MDAKRIFALLLAATITTMAAPACDTGDDDSDCMTGDCDSDSDSDTDGDTDSDTDSDTDTDSDSDSDTDTDTGTVDPTACDCLNGVSTDDGCVNIEGDFYSVGFDCCDPDHLMAVTLTPLEVNCRVGFSGDWFIGEPFEGTVLPMSEYFEESNVTIELYLEDSKLIQKMIHESSGDEDVSSYQRCDC